MKCVHASAAGAEGLHHAAKGGTRLHQAFPGARNCCINSYVDARMVSVRVAVGAVTTVAKNCATFERATLDYSIAKLHQ